MQDDATLPQSSGPAPAPALPPQVFAAELGEIDRRRRNAGLPPRPHPELEHPHVNQDLFGVAISGGGIRSGTFALGVLQTLAKEKLLAKVDYLSTVSGGGFTGSMLSSLLARAEKDQPFPLLKKTGHNEPAGLKHLRDHSEYLSSGSLAESLRLPMVIIRGLLLSMLLVAPFVIVAVFLTEVIYETGLWPHYDFPATSASASELTSDPPILFGFALFVFIVAVCFALPIRKMFSRRLSWARRNRGELLLSFALLAVLAAIAFEITLTMVGFAIETTPSEGGLWRTLVDLIGLSDELAQVLVISIGLGLPLLFYIGSRISKEHTFSALLYSAGLLGPGLIFAIYLGLCIHQVDSPFISAEFFTVTEADSEAEDAPDALLRYDLGLLGSELQRKDIDIDLDTVTLLRGSTTNDCNNPSTTELLLIRDIVDDAGASVSPSTLGYGPDDCLLLTPPDYDRSITTELETLTGLQTPRLLSPQQSCQWPELTPDGRLPLTSSFLNGCEHWLRITPSAGLLPMGHPESGPLFKLHGAGLELGGEASADAAWTDLHFIGTAAGLLLFVLFFYDVNTTSLHSFYRDRLSRMYLFQLGDKDEVVHCDSLKLSELNPEGSIAPYHLVNVVLNLGGADSDRRSRHGEFFILSKHFCGSNLTNYVDTKIVEEVDPHINLGTAMAISGAAASPNMGSLTSGSLTFIMTLLNLRMNYWMPNPSRLKQSQSRWRYRAGPRYLLHEAFGSATADMPLLNVSDGGHIENLGIYELLRRRCRLILVIDGEHDPSMSFSSLLTALRYADLDFGVQIDTKAMKLERFEADEEGISQTHWSVGTIDYGDDQTGTLIYIKSSLTAGLSPAHRHYRANNPTFPHESTADQFFSEEQFEAYRSLGEEITKGLLAAPPAALRDLIDPS